MRIVSVEDEGGAGVGKRSLDCCHEVEAENYPSKHVQQVLQQIYRGGRLYSEQ